MANQWLRLYAEFANDPKIQMLSEAMQRRFVMLMCIRCSNDCETFQDEEIAFQLRVSLEEVIETKALFVSKGFIDETWNLLNWEKRQFVSDSSTARVKRFREKSKTNSVKSETEVKRSSNVPEQNRTEQIQNRSKTLAPSPGGLAAGGAALGTFPCDGKQKIWAFAQSDVDGWQEAFPSLDVIAELRKAKAWIAASPERRKTATGMPKFVVGWLGRAQNSNGGNGNGRTYNRTQESVDTAIAGTRNALRLLEERGGGNRADDSPAA